MDNGERAAFAHGNPEQGGDSGLTKREYFAAMAMQGLLADGGDDWTKEYAAELIGIREEEYNPTLHLEKFIAMQSTKQADALLAALDRGK